MSDSSRDAELGEAMFELVRELYPICRSITGDGVRRTLAILARYAQLNTHEVPSGTRVLDWVVPPEWNIRDAWIKNPAGDKVVDFAVSNLHVVSYSVPVRARLSLDELRPHLHSLPAQPELVPYRTSYYEKSWGFCLAHRTLSALAPGEYEVCIDSTLEPGALSYGEIVLPGSSEDEILLSAHVCHPSLCDDNLSGTAVTLFLARELASKPRRRHTLRVIYAPGTIGAITWLARNRERASRVKHGLTVTCLGDRHPFTYKRSEAGNTVIDRAAAHVLAKRAPGHQLIDFFPYGYDERQYNSPGFRLAVGSLMRGRHGRFPEYHTSADDLGFVSPASLAESLAVCRDIVEVVDGDQTYENLAPFGEPQLGTRGLYRAIGGTNIPDLQFAMLWALNQSDGEHSLLDIAERSGLGFAAVRAAADVLCEHGLLREVEARPAGDPSRRP